ncbi:MULTISPECIES: DUF397 domain-containing protein [Actinomadura]|uniref:DUF397 domain-containing protein n=1 Tax=Actinomadura miaoliensis TaxID=430685 RepID=A0ABP7VTD5_9ACTN
MASGNSNWGSWRKSSRCGGSTTCVEVAALPGGVIGARDSARDGGPELSFSAAAWGSFVTEVKRGRFDLTRGVEAR